MQLRTWANSQYRAWMQRRNPPVRGTLSLTGRRIYILPTSAGLVFALMVFIILLSAMNYSNSMAFGVGFLLGAMGLVAMHHTHRNLLGLDVTGLGAEPVFAGDTLRFRVRLGNPGRKTRHGLELDTNEGTRDKCDLPAGTSKVVFLPCPTLRRGAFSAPRFHLACRFPLGLFRAWSPVKLEMSALVYPQPADDAPAIPATRGDQGHRASDQSGGQEDFHGLRDYRQGDPWRHISWQALAREQGLTTKLFAEPLDERRWLDWESLAPRSAETRLSILCRWILDCESRHLVYGLRLPDKTIAPASGAAHRERCLQALALFPREDA